MGLIECIQRLKALRTPGGPITPGTFTPPPPMTQADMEAEVNSLMAAGSMRPEGAEHLLRHMAIAAAKRGEAPARPAAGGSPLSAENAAFAKRLRLRQSLHEAGLWPEYWDLRLDRNPFLTEAGQPYRVEEGNRQAFKAMRRLAHSWQPGSPGLCLHSVSRGVSKTLLAAAALVYIRAMKTRAGGMAVRIRFVKAGELFGAMAASCGATWEKNPGVLSTEQVWQRFAALPDVLVIDDLGTEAYAKLDIGDWTREQFYRLADHRHSAKLTTIITTQLDETALTARYGGHVVSRLLARAPMVSITSTTDYRQSVEVDTSDPWED